MKRATILVGLPGCGKSTYIQNNLLVEGQKQAIISSDKWIELQASTVNSTYNDVFETYIKKATEIMNSDFHYYSTQRNDYDIIIDQTNLSVKKRKSWISRIPKDWIIDCVAFALPISKEDTIEWKLRLDSRFGKTIPKQILFTMSETYVIPTLDEGYSSLKILDLNGKEIPNG